MFEFKLSNVELKGLAKLNKDIDID